VPKSKVRQKKIYTPPAELGRPAAVRAAARRPSPVWVPALAVGLIVFGIGWLVTYYLSSGEYPVMSWTYWNLAIGFAPMVAALLVLSRWR
jgi:hypothetical protein